MFKRVVWFTVGAATGAGASVYGYVRLREASGRLAPDRVADTFVGTARTLGDGARSVGLAVGDSVREAVGQGRAAMVDAEARITAELDARPRAIRRLGELGLAAGPRPLVRDLSPDGRVRRAQ
jgi:hypothetical protein